MVIGLATEDRRGDEAGTAAGSGNKRGPELKTLRERLGELQRAVNVAGIPAIILFEGLQSAGKSEMANELLHAMDPRWYHLHPVGLPTQEELVKPFLWGFWKGLPPGGRIDIYDPGWYSRILAGWVEKGRKQPAFASRKDEAIIDRVNAFERQLTAETGSGQAKPYLILKIFLDVGRKEQKRRLNLLEKKQDTIFLLDDADWAAHEHFDADRDAIIRLIQLTDTGYAKWHVVDSNDCKAAALRVYDLVISALENRLAADRSGDSYHVADAVTPVQANDYPPVLSKHPTRKDMAEDEYRQRLKVAREALAPLQLKAYKREVPFVFVFEGMDTAGKGGSIKRLTEGLDPRGYEVVPIGAPNDVEKSRHYLWRFWTRFPARGYIAIFDRSWYGRVLVERVEGLTPKNAWGQSYDEINAIEKALSEDGTVITKFWLHIDPAVGFQRLVARESTPGKQWKITADDWRNHSKWDEYMAAADEMLARTNTAHAPWIIVPSDDKYYSRVTIAEAVVDAMKKAL